MSRPAQAAQLFATTGNAGELRLLNFTNPVEKHFSRFAHAKSLCGIHEVFDINSTPLIKLMFYEFFGKLRVAKSTFSITFTGCKLTFDPLRVTDDGSCVAAGSYKMITRTLQNHW